MGHYQQVAASYESAFFYASGPYCAFGPYCTLGAYCAAKHSFSFTDLDDTILKCIALLERILISPSDISTIVTS